MSKVYEYSILELKLQLKYGEVTTISYPTEGCGEVLAIQLMHDALLKGKKVCYYTERFTTSEITNMLRVRNFNTYYREDTTLDKLTVASLNYPLKESVKQLEQDAYKVLEQGEGVGSFAFVGKEVKLDDVVDKLMTFMESKNYDILIYESIQDFVKPLSMYETINELVPRIEEQGKIGIILNRVAYSRNYQSIQKGNKDVVNEDLKKHKRGSGGSVILMPETATGGDTSYILSVDTPKEVHHRFCTIDKATLTIPEYTFK